MKRIIKPVISMALFILFVGVVSFMIFADEPAKVIAYSGYAVNQDGDPLDVAYNFIFRLYDDAGDLVGDEVWIENHLLSIDQGYFSVRLGDDILNPLDFSFDMQYWLGITCEYEIIPPGGTYNTTEYATRIKLPMVPYSFNTDSIILEVLTTNPGSPVIGQMWLLDTP